MIKKLFLNFLVLVFTASALGLAVTTATNSVFGTPDDLKKSLGDSAVYETVADGFVDQAVKSTQKPAGEGAGAQKPEDDIQLDPELTEKVARKVITPDKLQMYAEQIVNGIYNWLEGETEQPDFNIDIGSLKTDFGNAVGDVAIDRIQTLPACTPAQLQTLDARNIDPLTLPCRPPGINLQAERAKLVSEVTSSKELLEDTTVTADDTKSEDTKKTPFEQLAYVPALFQLSQKLPWILGALGLASAAGIVFLSDDRRRGLKKLAVTLLVFGILLLIGITVANFVLGSIQLPNDAADGQQFGNAAIEIVRTLSAAFNRTLIIFAIIYTVTGLGGLIALHFTKPKNTITDKPASPEEKSVEHKDQEATEPKTGSDKPTKIQL